jgi:hypothetical protein
MIHNRTQIYHLRYLVVFPLFTWRQNRIQISKLVILNLYNLDYGQVQYKSFTHYNVQTTKIKLFLSIPSILIFIVTDDQHLRGLQSQHYALLTQDWEVSLNQIK